MGADIYLMSEIEKRRARNIPYNEIYTDECYFRDSYNVTSLYWLLGRSWWSDVRLVDPGDEYRNEDGELTEAGLVKGLEMQRNYLEAFRPERGYFEGKFDLWLKNQKGERDSPIDFGTHGNGADKWKEMFQSKIDRWIALQERAIALGELLEWSV